MGAEGRDYDLENQMMVREWDESAEHRRFLLRNWGLKFGSTRLRSTLELGRGGWGRH